MSETQQTVITIFCSSTEITSKKRKEQILANVCALLNSKGGDLVIDFSDQPQAKDLNQLERGIEQCINALMGTACMFKHVKFNVEPGKIRVNIRGWSKLCTVDYNMYLPSHSQINKVLPSEPLENIQDILLGKEQLEGSEFPAVHKEFVQESELGLTETYSVQFKLLVDSPSPKKNTTLADRISKNNKITPCVSAYANYRGGAIYVGVEDTQHLIKGQVIPEGEKTSIVEKLTRAINDMVWLDLIDGPCRGEHWDIHFYPVVDKEGVPVKSTFVIVIVVAKCFGGVFLKEPESYHLVDGKVEKMSLETWKEHFFTKRSRDQEENVDRRSFESSCASLSTYRSPEVRVHWSSIQIRKRYNRLNGLLKQMMNNGRWNEFFACAASEEVNCREGAEKLLVLAKTTTAHYKQGHFPLAQRDLEEYHSRLVESKDRLITELKEAIIRSAYERSQGRIQESYEHAENGLALAEQTPAGILPLECYSNIAKVITILLELETDLEKKKYLKERASFFFKLALEHLEIDKDYLPSSIFDQKKKIHINLAFLHLGCSLSAGKVTADHKVEDAAILEAVNSLDAVEHSVNEGYPLSDYRNCQHLLARSMLFCRKSQNAKPNESEERKANLLNSAMNYAEEARKIAIERNFDEMLQCTTKFISFFTHLLDTNIIEQVNET